MGMRMTGLISGLDTESMVQELVSASSEKVDKVKQEKQDAEWKKEIWSSLNTKIYSFYKTQLASFKTVSNYQTKKATASDDTKVSVKAGSGASNGTHTVSVKQTASSAYLTGANIKAAGKTYTKYAEDGTVESTLAGSDISSSTKLTDLGIKVGTTFSVKGHDFVVDADSTISSFTTAVSKMGVSASFDSTQGRIYINASKTGAANDFDITSSDADALAILGLSEDSGATKIDARDAIIDYNGVEYTGDSNTFTLNGLTITAKSVTGTYDAATGSFTNDSPINIEVANDTDSAYNTIKSFVKAYNELIEEMNTLYDEEDEGYDALTDDEKSELSDTQIEKWEEKAKKGLLRRDSTLQTLLSNMRTTLNKGVTVTLSDGTTKTMSLASLGIVTGDYTEDGKLHIMGDEDDEEYSSYTNKLKEALESDDSLVSQIVGGESGVGTQMYDYLRKSMTRIEGSRSSQTFYYDKQLDSEIDDYEDEIEELEEKLQDLEDKYYDQFSAMETAMAKLQSQQSYLSSLLGG